MSEKLKVLHIINTIGPRYGGPSQVCLDLCKALVRSSVEATIYTTIIDSPFPKNMPNGGEVILDGVKIRLFPIAGPKFYWISPELSRALRHEVQFYDVVHIHSLYRYHFVAAVQACTRAGVPFIIRPHGSLDPFLYFKKRWRKLPHELLFERPAFKKAAAIHYTAEREKLLACSVAKWISQGNSVVVRNGVTIPHLHADAKKTATENFFLNFPELADKDIILFLGRINFKKGLDILVDGFAHVAQTRPKSHLVIAGPDNERYGDQVRKRIKERGLINKSTFVGLLRGEAKLAAFLSAKVFVLPSYSENFGNAIVEAMSMECPVVISDQVNIWQEISDAGAGIVVPCAPSEIARAIERVLDDKKNAALLGGRGKILVEQRYDWNLVAKEVIALYRDVADNNGLR